MYFYEPSIEGFVVRDEERNIVARVAVEADAREVVAALNLVNAVAEEFPGLRGDATDEKGELIEQEVDGADLVDFIVGRVEWAEDGRFHEAGKEVAATVVIQPPDKVVCPHCGHDGTLGDRLFTFVEDAELLRPVRGVEDGTLLVQACYEVNDVGGEARLFCPACGRTFLVPPGFQLEFVD
jgi:hypothetical protein